MSQRDNEPFTDSSAFAQIISLASCQTSVDFRIINKMIFFLFNESKNKKVHFVISQMK